MKNTFVMCVLKIVNQNREDGYRYVDVGNYFIKSNVEKCLVLTEELAKKYVHLCDVPVYVRNVN